MEQAMAKGVTHWSNGSFDKPGEAEAFRKNPDLALKEYYAVPRIREIFNLSGKVDGHRAASRRSGQGPRPLG